MPWDNKPTIFTEDGTPATTNKRFNQQWEEEMREEEIPRTCPWCGLLCESVPALEVHEAECE